MVDFYDQVRRDYQSCAAPWRRPYLERQGDLVSRLIGGILRVTMWGIEAFNLVATAPWPAKYARPTHLIINQRETLAAEFIYA